MGKTSIEWCDHSWPVVNGCRRVSAGCENCYAERLTATRLSRTPKYEGLAVMKPGKEKVLRRDLADGSVRLTKLVGPAQPRWTGKARLWAEHLEMPIKLRKPSRIFVCDMGDLFYEEVADEEIAAVFAVMAGCPRHTFQVLTKRPERARAWLQACGEPPKATGFVTHNGHEPAAYGGDGIIVGSVGNWPLANVWLGTSLEDQATADERIPILLDTPAALRFVSAEPLLGPVDLMPYLHPMHTVIAHPPSADRAKFLDDLAKLQEGACVLVPESSAAKVEIIRGVGLDWVIVGGESGPGARPFDLGWARRVVDACAAARVACFVKQLGAQPFWVDPSSGFDLPFRLGDRKGGETSEWPDDLRVRQFPKPVGAVVSVVAAGNDGTVSEQPAESSPVSRPSTAELIVAALGPGMPLTRAELAEETGATETAVASSLTRLRRNGRVQVEDGYWTLVPAEGVSDAQA